MQVVLLLGIYSKSAKFWSHVIFVEADIFISVCNFYQSAASSPLTNNAAAKQAHFEESCFEVNIFLSTNGSRSFKLLVTKNINA